MLIPTKHEQLEKNILVLGGDILEFFKKKKCWNTENLFQCLKEKKLINLGIFYDTLTFLWLCGLVEVKKDSITINKNETT